MNTKDSARTALLIVQGFIGVTALAGGATLVVGALDPGLTSVMLPPVGYLDGSPFSSYLIPGLALAVGLGGVHIAVFLLLLRRHRVSLLASAVGAFDTLIWIFVQMAIIPFSFLQAVYFVAGLAEVGLLLLLLGITRATSPTANTEERTRVGVGATSPGRLGGGFPGGD